MSLSIYPFHAQQFEQLIIHDLYLSVYPPVYNSLTGGGGSLAPDRLFEVSLDLSPLSCRSERLKLHDVTSCRRQLAYAWAGTCVDELAQPTKLDAISHFDAGILHQCHIDSSLNHKPTCLPLFPLCARLFPPLLCFQGLRRHSFMWCFLSSPLSATQHKSGPLQVAQVIRYGGALSLSHSLQASSLLTLPLSSFVLSLALHGSVVPGYLPQLQPDADTGSAGYGSESPGSVKGHFIQRAMLLSLFFCGNTSLQG